MNYCNLLYMEFTLFICPCCYTHHLPVIWVVVSKADSINQSQRDQVAQLSQFMQRFGGFGKSKRPQCWQILLQLPGNHLAYDTSWVEV